MEYPDGPTPTKAEIRRQLKYRTVPELKLLLKRSGGSPFFKKGMKKADIIKIFTDGFTSMYSKGGQVKKKKLNRGGQVKKKK